MVTPKYKPGDILRQNNVTYRIVYITESAGTYALLRKIDGFPDVMAFHGLIENIDNDKSYTLEMPHRYEPPKCECGAAKLGYIKPSKHHSWMYCKLYKET